MALPPRKTPKPKLNPQTLAILGRHIQQTQPNKAAEEISRDFEAAMKAAGPKPVKKKPG